MLPLREAGGPGDGREKAALKRSRNRPPTWVLLFIVFAFPSLLAFFFLPTGFVLEGPGASFDLLSRVEVRGWDVLQDGGEFLLTSVLVDEASMAEVLFALVSPDYELAATKEAGIEEDTEFKDDLYTCVSRMSASALALKEAGAPVEVRRLGAAVMETAPGFPAEGILKPGDVILEVEGTRILGADELKRAISRFSPGVELELTVDELEYEDAAALTFRLAGRARKVRVSTAEADGEPVIGVVVADWFEYHSPVEVIWDLGSVRGPSAGLMMALTLYGLLSREALAGGKKVAGTGTIDLEGRVGPIGGLPLKVKAAERSGAEIFLYPEENGDEALSVETRMRMIPVGSFEEALEALRENAGWLPGGYPQVGHQSPASMSPALP